MKRDLLLNILAWLPACFHLAGDTPASRGGLAADENVYQVFYSRLAQPSGKTWDSCKISGPMIAPWSPGKKDNTTFRAFYNDNHFYFRFEAEDMSITDNTGGDNESAVANGDRVELFLSGSADLASYYCIEISPWGNVLDYHAKFYRQFDDKWDLDGLITDVRISKNGYMVEGKIPVVFFRSLLRVESLSDQQVRAGIFRAELPAERGKQAFTWFSWVNPKSPAPDFHIPSAFGVFRFE